MIARHETVVVGGGVVGAALALALRRAGVDVALVERGSGPKRFDAADYDLRVYAISPGSAHWLTELGVWPQIAARRVSPYQEMRVWHDRADHGLNFSAAENRLADLGWIVEHDLLQSELWQALAGVAIYRGAAVESCDVQSDRARLVLDDGRELKAALVAAADGADSRLRALAGIQIASWSYPQQAIVCNVATARPHRRTAWQRFLPTGPLAFLPLADGRSSIVWSTTDAAELMRLADDDFRARLGDAIQHELGEIGAITPRAAFPLKLLHARDYVRGPLVLLGDAAHVVHPLAGQGVNMGLADARALAGVIAQQRAAGKPIAAARALNRYARSRKADNLEMLALTDALHRAFGPRAPWFTGTLELGMQALDRLVPIKTRLARRALGL